MTKLKALRELRGITLRELQDETGIQYTYLHNLEHGRIKTPSEKTLTKLQNVYGQKWTWEQLMTPSSNGKNGEKQRVHALTPDEVNQRNLEFGEITSDRQTISPDGLPIFSPGLFPALADNLTNDLAAAAEQVKAINSQIVQSLRDHVSWQIEMASRVQEMLNIEKQRMVEQFGGNRA